MKSTLTPILLLAMLLVCLTPSRFVYAQEGQRCFRETGYCISGRIRDYWQRNGGLPVFGYPISNAQVETIEGSWTGSVQWFERDRLEDHQNEGLGVLAGRLGVTSLELQGRPWESFPTLEPQQVPSICRYFVETKHSLCEPFLSYWRNNGGLQRFGYPITEVDNHLINGQNYQAQYFERRRMEYHPEYAGTSYEVLLGLLGRDIFPSSGASIPPCPSIGRILQRTWTQYAFDLGCGQQYGSGQLATQPFEHGALVWVERGDGGPGQIFVIVTPVNGAPSWLMYIDTFVEGEQIGTDELAPPGKYVPVRGFGKLWRTVPEVRQSLGWATAPEQAESGMTLQFPGSQGLSWMIYRAGSEKVYILRAQPNGNSVTDIERVR